MDVNQAIHFELLAVLRSMWWLILPALLGVGMITAAAFGTCNMTRFLSWLPWNERHSGDIRTAP
jgi:hypothetical protein